jgi:aerobic-type carbon monoxide dehydrogenase small subunit (CoxS/CutS family)
MAKSPITGAGVRLRINGSEHLLQIEPRVTLFDALRSFPIELTLRQTESGAPLRVS